MAWTNKDGLTVLMHKEQGEDNFTGSTIRGATQEFVLNIDDATTLEATAPTPSALDGFIPAGAYITRAYIIVDEAFDSSGSATLTVGVYEQDGTAIDADGIDAAVALTAIDADGDVVVADGALVGGTATVGTADAYIVANYGTAAFTAGSAKVVIEYIKV